MLELEQVSVGDKSVVLVTIKYERHVLEVLLLLNPPFVASALIFLSHIVDLQHLSSLSTHYSALLHFAQYLRSLHVSSNLRQARHPGTEIGYWAVVSLLRHTSVLHRKSHSLCIRCATCSDNSIAVDHFAVLVDDLVSPACRAARLAQSLD